MTTGIDIVFQGWECVVLVLAIFAAGLAVGLHIKDGDE